MSYLRLLATWLFVLALPFGALGCKQPSGDSLIVVTAAGDLAGVRQLRVSVVMESSSQPAGDLAFPATAADQDLSLPETFSLRMPTGRSGRATLRVSALSENGSVIAEESTGLIAFSPGAVSIATVCFGRCVADGGVALDANDGGLSDGSLISDGSFQDVGSSDSAPADGNFDAAVADRGPDGSTDAAMADAAMADAAMADAALADAEMADAAMPDAALADAAMPDAALADAAIPDASSPNFICPQSGWCRPPGMLVGPPARSNHSAVWTGTEMIVWGGRTGGSETNDGYSWNATTGFWTPMTQTGSIPTPRDEHSAVWTGTEMIIWGGHRSQNPIVYLESGYRWNASTGVWTPMAQSGAVPSPRREHSAVWTGTEMVVWGGSNGPGLTVLGDGYRWNAMTGSWSAITQTGVNVWSRHEHSAVWTGSEMIVWGGYAGDYLNDGFRLNVTTGVRRLTTQSGSVPTSASDSAVWTGNELVSWIWDEGYRWNATTGIWTLMPRTGSPPLTRRYHSAVWTGREMIVWGGEGMSDGAVWRP